MYPPYLLTPALTLFLPLTAFAANPDLEGQINDILSAPDTTPTAAEITALGAEGADMLQAIATDATVTPSKRARALHALGYFPTEEHRTLLLAFARNPEENPLLRRSAVWALVNGWHDAVLPEISPLLNSEDVQLRITTVRAISQLPAESTRPLLLARLEVETNEAVRQSIQDALK